MKLNEKVNQFLDAVCLKVKCQEVHPDIRLELESHIAEIVAQEQDCGTAESEAVDIALMCMGDPLAVGTSLDKVHRPHLEWRLVLLLAALVGTGFFTMFSLTGLSGPDLLRNTLIGALPGSSLALFLFFTDYRKVTKLAPHVMGMLLLLLVIATLPIHQGMSSVALQVATANPYYLAISSGILLIKYRGGSLKEQLITAGVVCVPALLLLRVPSLTAASIHMVVCFAILATSRSDKKRVILVTLAIAAILLSMALVSLRPYQSARLMAFIDPHSDPHGAGYMNARLFEAVQQGGPFGQRELAVPGAVPEAHTDFVFVYLIYRYGWVTGMALALLSGMFIMRLIHISRSIREPVGRAIVVGLTTIFALKFCGSILVSLSKVPLISITFPFISYGRVLLVSEFVVVGLILSVYRIKDMVSFVPEGRNQQQA